MNKNFRYIQFPLCLLGYLHLAPRAALNLIISYGIVRFSDQMRGSDDENIFLRNCFRQVLYEYLRGQLPFGINRWISTLINTEKLYLDETSDYGRDGRDFEFCDTESDLMEAADLEPDKRELCIRFYKLKSACKLLGVKETSYEKIWDNFLEAHTRSDAHQEHFGSDAIVSVKIDLLLDFCKNQRISQEYDLLAAYCAIKSILGSKKFVATNKIFIAARMVGAKDIKTWNTLQSVGDETSNSDAEILRSVFTKYSTRYHNRKIIEALIKRGWLSCKISEKATRCVYLSTTLTFPQLAEQIHKLTRRKKARLDIRSNEQQAIEYLARLRAEDSFDAKNPYQSS